MKKSVNSCILIDLAINQIEIPHFKVQFLHTVYLTPNYNCVQLTKGCLPVIKIIKSYVIILAEYVHNRISL